MNFDFNKFFFSDEDNKEEGLEEEIKDMNMSKKKLEDMTEEEKEEFRNSEKYKNLSAKFKNSSTVNRNGKSIEDILNLSDRHSRLRYSYNSIKSIIEEIELYEEMVDDSPLMQKTIAEGERLISTFKYLHQDIFLSLYEYNVEVLPEEDIHYEVRLNRMIMERLVNTPEYIALRNACRMDPFNAALGTEIIGADAIGMIEEMLEKLREKNIDVDKQIDSLSDLADKEEEMDSISDKIEELQDEADELLSRGDEQGADELLEKADELADQLDELRDEAMELAKQCEDITSDASKDKSNSLGTQILPALGNATNEVQEVTGICNTFGLGVGSTVKIPYAKKKHAIETIRRSPKILQMTDAIGKFKEAAITEQKKKAKHGMVEISTTTMGSKIEDTLPSERMNMINDVTKKDFMRRMTENSLMTYEKESNKQKNKGPIIVCVDTSGSMSGNRETWSKAMACAVMEIAQFQKRDFACILYSSSADDPIVIAKDEIDPDKVIKIVETFEGGGTDFQRPLEKASKLIEDSMFKEADILFISDGECGLNNSFINKFKNLKEQKDFRCLGVQIGGSPRSRSGRDRSYGLGAFCDTVTNIEDIADLNNAESVANKGIFNML